MRKYMLEVIMSVGEDPQRQKLNVNSRSGSNM